jgi:hypothetical protein
MRDQHRLRDYIEVERVAIVLGHLPKNLPLPDGLDRKLEHEEEVVVEILDEKKPMLNHQRKSATEHVAIEIFATTNKANTEPRCDTVVQQEAQTIQEASNADGRCRGWGEKQSEASQGLWSPKLPQADHQKGKCKV